LNALTKQRQKIQIAIATNNSSSPSGLVWMVIIKVVHMTFIYSIVQIWSTNVKEDSEKSTSTPQVIICLFRKYMNGQTSFETARETIRCEIHSQSPAEFAYVPEAQVSQL